MFQSPISRVSLLHLLWLNGIGEHIVVSIPYQSGLTFTLQFEYVFESARHAVSIPYQSGLTFTRGSIPDGKWSSSMLFQSPISRVSLLHLANGKAIELEESLVSIPYQSGLSFTPCLSSALRRDRRSALPLLFSIYGQNITYRDI